jgi:hypothetical protein
MIDYRLNPITGEVLVCLGNVAKDLRSKRLRISRSSRVGSDHWSERINDSGRSFASVP